MSETQAITAAAAGTITIGGDLTVNRLGYGAMRITGEGVWGEPADRAGCVRTVRRAVELGVDLIDTADSYGPEVSEDVLDHCEAEGIGFIPWFPVAAGALADPGGPVDAVVHETGATPSQVALAWLLRRSPVILPIPGTKSVDHVEENCRAALLELSEEQMAALGRAAG